MIKNDAFSINQDFDKLNNTVSNLLNSMLKSKRNFLIWSIEKVLLPPPHYSGFLLNLRKYGLGSLRKTPTEGIPPIGLGPSWDNQP